MNSTENGTVAEFPPLSPSEFQLRLGPKILALKSATGFGAYDEGLAQPWVFGYNIGHWVVLQILAPCLLLGVVKVILYVFIGFNLYYTCILIARVHNESSAAVV